jgi:hypothetical protein
MSDQPLPVGTITCAYPRYGHGEYTFYRVKEHRTPRVIILEKLAAARDAGYGDAFESGHKYWLEQPIRVVGADVRATVSKQFGWSIKGPAADGRDREILMTKPMPADVVFQQQSFY